MTTTTTPFAGREHDSDLRQFLGAACFPAGTDELQATLIRHRAPTRLLWLVAGLPYQRRYADLDEVLDDLGDARPPELPREPF